MLALADEDAGKGSDDEEMSEAERLAHAREHGERLDKKSGPLLLYIPLQVRPGKPSIPPEWATRHAVIRDGDLLFYENADDDFPTEVSGATCAVPIRLADACMLLRPCAVCATDRC